MEDVGAVYLPAVVPAVLSAGVTMVLLAKQITRLLERHYSVVFHGIIGIVLAATLVIVPFSAFGNPETSAVSLICLTAGAGTALPLHDRQLLRAAAHDAAVFHAGGNVTGDVVGRQPVFFCIGSVACGAC